MRPLSQIGLRRIAHSALQRPRGEGGIPDKRTRLEAFNDRQTGRYLHPTKGWRTVSVKRSIAAMLTAEIKSGRVGFSMEGARKMLRGVPKQGSGR